MSWLTLTNPQDVDSPGLLIDPDRVQANIERMIAAVGGPDHTSRLRPHLKTHKMARVVRMQLDAGITHFKAATMAEAEMAAGEGATDVLIAHQPVGPKVDRLAGLIERFPATSFACIVDDASAAGTIAARAGDPARPLRLFVDVDCGQGRTGVPFGPGLDALRDAIGPMAGATYAGLHVYDGHLHDPSEQVRREAAMAIIERTRVDCARHTDQAVVACGSPTFGIWASETPWQLSCGTTLLWDVGYGRKFTELPFEVAAALITRVISKPGDDRICLDLGHKAVAAENLLDNRVLFPELPAATVVSQSEEHLVLDVPGAGGLAVGDVLIGYPTHICPTVALHARATVVRGGVATGETWTVSARDR
jgi:D-serine deaminase-like pyridoxal phosphate-dependent protein